MDDDAQLGMRILSLIDKKKKKFRAAFVRESEIARISSRESIVRCSSENGGTARAKRLGVLVLPSSTRKIELQRIFGVSRRDVGKEARGRDAEHLDIPV